MGEPPGCDVRCQALEAAGLLRLSTLPRRSEPCTHRRRPLRRAPPLRRRPLSHLSISPRGRPQLRGISLLHLHRRSRLPLPTPPPPSPATSPPKRPRLSLTSRGPCPLQTERPPPALRRHLIPRLSRRRSFEQRPVRKTTKRITAWMTRAVGCLVSRLFHRHHRLRHLLHPFSRQQQRGSLQRRERPRREQTARLPRQQRRGRLSLDPLGVDRGPPQQLRAAPVRLLRRQLLLPSEARLLPLLSVATGRSRSLR